MPTIFTHTVVGLSAATAISGKSLPKKFWPLAVLCAILPDANVLAFKFGIPYAHAFGHRGFFHSLFFAALVGLCVTAIFFREARLGSRSWWFYIASFSAITALHSLLDAMTDGGLGIALLAPFDNHRYFFAFRPIAVSPIAPHKFFTEQGLNVLKNELLWVWFPALLVAFFCRLSLRQGSAMRR